MKVPFYILGLLMRYGPQHGYNIKQIVSEGIADFANIKLPTIYYHLEKLAIKGYVASNVGKDGNRPEKIIYSITDSGITYFNSLLNKILQENYSVEFNYDGALYFHSFTYDSIIIKNLKKQEEYIQNQIKKIIIHKENTISMLPPEHRPYSKSIFNHHIYHLETELKWIAETIKELS